MRFLGRQSRERTTIAVLAAVLAAVAAWQFALLPLLHRHRVLVRQVAAKEEALDRLRSLATEYRALAARFPDPAVAIAGRPAGFSLLSFLEDAARTAGVRRRIAGMKPAPADMARGYRGTVVEVRFDRLSLAGLVRFVEQAHRPEMAVYVRRLAIRRASGPGGGLDARCEIVALEEGEG